MIRSMKRSMEAHGVAKRIMRHSMSCHDVPLTGPWGVVRWTAKGAGVMARTMNRINVRLMTHPIKHLKPDRGPNRGTAGESFPNHGAYARDDMASHRRPKETKQTPKMTTILAGTTHFAGHMLSSCLIRILHMR